MTSRNDALDGIRGISILLVVLSHFIPFSGIWAEFINGAVGVSMFFVLSGYFIGLQILKIEYPSVSMKDKPWMGLMNFYLRRFLRIIPLYLLVILAVYLFPFPVPTSVKENLGTYLLMNQNWMMFSTHTFDGILAPLWSLSVEVKFYLIWPLVYVFFSERNYLRFTLIMLLAGIAGRLVAGYYSRMDGYANLLLISAIDCFAAGLLISRINLMPEKWQNPASRSWRMLLSAAVLMYALFVFTESFYIETVFRRTAINIMCAWLILVCIRGNGKIPSILSNRVLTYFGTRSYSIYVMHGMSWWILSWIILLINKVGYTSLQLPGGWQYFAMQMIVILLIAEFAYRTIEIPFNKLRHRLT